MSTDLEARLRRYGTVLDRARPAEADSVKMPDRRRHRPWVLTAAAAIVVVVLGASLWSGSESQRVEVGPANRGEVPATEPRADAAEPPAELRAIWPATTAAGLEQSQAAAESGERGDLLDPRQVARGYLIDRLGGPGNDGDLASRLSIGELHSASGDDVGPGVRPDDEDSGYVTYLLDSPQGPYEGYVQVRRLRGEGSIWYVTGSGTPSIGIERVSYDGRELAINAATDFGRLDAEINAVKDAAQPVVVPFDVSSASYRIELPESFLASDDSSARGEATVMLRLFPQPDDGTTAETPVTVAEMRINIYDGYESQNPDDVSARARAKP